MKIRLSPVIPLFLAVLSFQLAAGQRHALPEGKGFSRILYFSPEIEPDIDELKAPTYEAFFSAVSDHAEQFKKRSMLRVEDPLNYDDVDDELVKIFCENNDADFAIVPKIQYFKVGIGQYVISNQAVVSMKLFDKEGNLISESSYDTLRRKYRVLGSTENSVKIGTSGAMNDIKKEIRRATRKNLKS